MNTLTSYQTLSVSGGISNEEIGDKVTDGLDKSQEVIDEGRDDVAEQLDKIADKIKKD
jgi:hypothetical protein